MTGRATARVEARAKASTFFAGQGAGHGVDLLETALRIVEEVEDGDRVVRGNRRECASCSGPSAPDARIDLGERGSRGNEQTHQSCAYHTSGHRVLLL